MSAFATIVGSNWDGTLTGETGPVNYVPSQIDPNGVAIWYTANSVLDARYKMTMSVRQPVKGSQVARVQVKLVHPVMDGTDPTLKVGENLANIEFVFSKRATQAQRELLVGHILTFCHDSTEMGAAVASLESIY